MTAFEELTIEPGLLNSTDDFLSVLKPIMRGIAMTFGKNCEVVLHDFRDPERSIVHIEGNVTNRKPGGSVTQIGLGLIAQGSAAEDQINYITRSPKGRVLKSSTILLRDSDNNVFGAICINFDITDLRRFQSALDELAGTDPEAEPKSVAFVDDVSSVISAVIQEEAVALGVQVERMAKQDRIEIISALNRRGIFGLQRSAPLVAEKLQISRATLYSYLDQARSRAHESTGASSNRSDE